jgi:hypothetical protein
MAHAAGFAAAVVPTPMGMRFLGEVKEIEQATGFPVRSEYKRPEDPDALPLADAFLVSPLTFNTLNAWAAGLSPTLALGLINEALGMDVPVTAVPWVNAQLSRHPAARESVIRLREAGVRFTTGFGHPSSRIPGPDGQIGTPVYPWDEIEAEIRRMADELVDVPGIGR